MCGPEKGRLMTDNVSIAKGAAQPLQTTRRPMLQATAELRGYSRLQRVMILTFAQLLARVQPLFPRAIHWATQSSSLKRTKKFHWYARRYRLMTFSPVC